MSFTDEAAELRRNKRRASCVELAMQLNPELAEDIRAGVWDTLDRSDVSRPAMSEVFSKHGIKVTVKMIQFHVNGQCACDPETTGRP